mgnify:CR=1 FL=1
MNQMKKTTSEEVLTVLLKRGYIGDSRIANEKARIAQSNKQRKAYHNTELLLKNYRNIAWMLECFPDAIAEELDKPFKRTDEMIDKLDVELAMGNRKLENRMEGLRKTRLVLDRINEALTVLKRKPGDGERLYELVYLTYISSESLSHQDLIYRLNLSTRHYYRLRESAIEIISLRLWSSPSGEVDAWLEILSALESGQ